MSAEISKKDKKSKKRAAAEALESAAADTTMEVEEGNSEPKVKKSKKSKDKSSKDADAKDKSSAKEDAALIATEICPIAKPRPSPLLPQLRIQITQTDPSFPMPATVAQSKLSKKVLRTVKKCKRTFFRST